MGGQVQAMFVVRQDHQNCPHQRSLFQVERPLRVLDSQPKRRRRLFGLGKRPEVHCWKRN